MFMTDTAFSGLDDMFSDDSMAALRIQAEARGISISRYIYDVVMTVLEDADDEAFADAAYSRYLAEPESRPFAEYAKERGIE